MNKENNYYEVIAKCGHVGKRYYVPIKFQVCASSGKEAAKVVRQFPRVKHNHKDAILSVKKIDYKTYLEIESLNSQDLYLQCRSRSEQKKLVDLSDRLVEDAHSKRISYGKESRTEKIKHKIRKYEIIEKYLYEGEDYDYVC